MNKLIPGRLANISLLPKYSCNKTGITITGSMFDVS